MSIEQCGDVWYYWHPDMFALPEFIREGRKAAAAAALKNCLESEGHDLDFDPDTIRMERVPGGQHSRVFLEECVAFELLKPEPEKEAEEYFLLYRDGHGMVQVEDFRTQAEITAWLREHASYRTFATPRTPGAFPREQFNNSDITMIIKGEVVVPREKAVLREYEVD